MSISGMMIQRSRRAQRGVSLIEVLLAMLIFSIGLLGLADLIIVSLRATQAAYLRTQAIVLAQAMTDRMRANPLAVWGGDYDGSYPHGSSASTSCGPAACNSAQRARQDGLLWGRELTAALPGAVATIACSTAMAGATPDHLALQQRPPYGGNCKIRIGWREPGHADTASQIFSWNFQP